MSAESEHDDLARDLHAMRAEPRPEFARELDRKAAGWLGERRRRRLPSLRIAIPAVAAAAAAVVVIAVVAGGEDGGGDAGGQLEVAVVSEGPAGGGLAAPQTGTAPGAATPEDSLSPQLERETPQQQATGGAFLLPSVKDGTLTVRYLFPAPTEAKVSLAGREADVTLEAGSGSLEISTEGLPAGSHELTITTPSAPTYREQIQIGG